MRCILRNPCYYGQGQWGKRHYIVKDNGEGKDIRRVQWTAEDSWLTIKYPPIIDETSHKDAAVRRKHQTRERLPGWEESKYLLKGLLWCEHHAKPYSVQRSNNSKQYRYRYYVCLAGARYADMHGVCPQPRINGDYLEERVAQWIMDLLTEPKHLEALTYDYMARLKEGGGLEALEHAGGKLSELEEEARRVMISYERGWRTEQEVEWRMKTINEQREYYQEEFDRAEAATRDLQATIEILNALGDQAQEEFYLKHLQAIPQEELVKMLVKRVTVTERPAPDDLQVIFNLSSFVLLQSPRWQ